MIVVLNNKCNLNKQEFIEYKNSLSTIESSSKIILCPSALNIGIFDLTNVELGSQNVSKNDNGSHTGEVSADQLKSYGVNYCIIGHSERRNNQKETDKELNLKIINLLKAEITPILCVGETLGERKAGLVNQIINKQIEIATKDLTEEETKQLIIAYEPVWSIGTGEIPTNEQISTILTEIKSLLPNTKVLYGGSANENNIEKLKMCSQIDGYLLGGLSLKIDLLKVFLEKLEN